jgi:hypothetical protein
MNMQDSIGQDSTGHSCQEAKFNKREMVVYFIN